MPITLEGSVWYMKRPFTLAVRNSEFRVSWLIPVCCVADRCIFFIKKFFSGAVNCKLSMSILPIIWSIEPPLKFAFTFTENVASSYLGVRFSSCGRKLLTEAEKSKVGTFSVRLISPLIAIVAFSSFNAALPLNPPRLYSPSRVIFSYL